MIIYCICHYFYYKFIINVLIIIIIKSYEMYYPMTQSKCNRYLDSRTFEEGNALVDQEAKEMNASDVKVTPFKK